MTSCNRPSPIRENPISLLLHEGAVLVAGAEIDGDLADPVAVESKELRVAEFLSIVGDAAIQHEGFVALREDFLDIAGSYALAVWPASGEIFRPVDRVVIGAGEGEVVGQQVFDELAVLR